MRGQNPLTDFIQAVVKRLRLSDGTILDLDTVADNEYLKRSGTTIVGSTPSGTSLTVKEVDGSPIVTPTTTIEFENAVVTDEGSGMAKVVCGGSTVTTRIITVAVTIQSPQTGVAIPAGTQVDIPFDFDGTILGWALLADQVGSCVIDLWKDTVGNYPPTVADTITASAKPTLSTDDYASSTVLTGWTTSVLDGQTIRVNVDSCTSIERLVLKLRIQTTAVSSTAMTVTRLLIFEFDGGGQALTTSVEHAVIIACPFNGDITEIYIKDAQDIAGTCTIDIWKDARGNPTPDSADKITGTGTKPFIAGPASESTPQTTFANWGTTHINQNDEIHAVLQAVTAFKHLFMYVKVTES